MFLAANFLDPLVHALTTALFALHGIVPNYGWALIVLALIVRLVMWPLTEMQFRSMAEMQKVQPLVKQIQAKYKNDPQKQNAETMALYKEHKVNPLAGCIPMLIPIPILIALYWAIQNQVTDKHSAFWHEHWLWIGSALSERWPHLFANSLAVPDVFLLVLYVVSMYFTVRFGSPPSQDPQQAQTQKIMAIVSPAMIAYFGFQYKWASALYIYWLALNVFTVAQQFWMYRRYGLIGKGGLPTAGPPAVAAAPAATEQPALKDAKPAANGKRAYRPKKRSRR